MAHDERYLDIPLVARRSGATVVGHKTLCDYLKWRSHIDAAKLVAVGQFETCELPGFKISAFKWKHRDINLYKALTKAVFHGNAPNCRGRGRVRPTRRFIRHTWVATSNCRAA